MVINDSTSDGLTVGAWDIFIFLRRSTVRRSEMQLNAPSSWGSLCLELSKLQVVMSNRLVSVQSLHPTFYASLSAMAGE